MRPSRLLVSSEWDREGGELPYRRASQEPHGLGPVPRHARTPSPTNMRKHPCSAARPTKAICDVTFRLEPVRAIPFSVRKVASYCSVFAKINGQGAREVIERKTDRETFHPLIPSLLGPRCAAETRAWHQPRELTCPFRKMTPRRGLVAVNISPFIITLSRLAFYHGKSRTRLSRSVRPRTFSSPKLSSPP